MFRPQYTVLSLMFMALRPFFQYNASSGGNCGQLPFHTSCYCFNHHFFNYIQHERRIEGRKEKWKERRERQQDKCTRRGNGEEREDGREEERGGKREAEL